MFDASSHGARPRYDDEIFEHVMKDFPELAEEPYHKLVKIDEELMKSPEGKERWRKFIAEFVVSRCCRCNDVCSTQGTDTRRRSRTSTLVP